MKNGITIKTKTILIVDDDFQLRNLLETTFSEQDLIVLTAPNGAKALKILSQVSVNLVIVDMIMPEKDGIETISFISENYPGIKIIAVSGGSITLNATLLTDMALKVGAHAAIHKPFKLDDIIEKVKMFLQLDKIGY
jgi:two-component system, chemotaxis family, chemotaxis protein CheY